MKKFVKKVCKKIRPTAGWHTRQKPSVKFKLIDEELLSNFSSAKFSFEHYTYLFKYFTLGVKEYTYKESCFVLYPGEPSAYGLLVDCLEGFARTAPLLAVWLNDNSHTVSLMDGTDFDVYEHLSSGLTTGTNPNSKHYWGDITDYNQRCVEAADIALSVWLLKKSSSITLMGNEQLTQILSWLDKINSVKISDNNWLLFRLIINTVLADFNYSKDNEIENDFSKFEELHLGDGWYKDGKHGEVDYYNVWQIQYFLFWFTEISGKHRNNIATRMKAFCRDYKYFISPNGVPIFGRSTCYRGALSAPFFANYILSGENPGIAKRAFEATWTLFITKGAIKSGTFSQGYYESMPELLEFYSGRASAQWSLRSLILALYIPKESKFWSSESSQLPIEKASFSEYIKAPTFLLEGELSSGNITLKIHNNEQLNYYSRLPFWRRTLQNILRRPLRYTNFEAKYKNGKYYSNKNFYDND